MSSLKNGISAQRVELSKTVLLLAALALFAKLLNVDLSNVQVLGVSLGPAHGGLIPGFLGIALLYALVALVASVVEGFIQQQMGAEFAGETERLKKNGPLMAVSFLTMPFSLVAYGMPYLLGLFALYLLRHDTWAVARSLWLLATA